jgi:uncharacterized protein
VAAGGMWWLRWRRPAVDLDAPQEDVLLPVQEFPDPEEPEVPPEELEAMARQGSAPAQRRWAESLERAASTPAEFQQAHKWYYLAATQGDVSAQKKLYEYYWNGKTGAPIREEALAWLERAAGDGGDAGAQYQLALHLERGEDVKADPMRAWELYSQAAIAGHAAASFEVARHLREGKLVEKNLNEAYAWFEKAATAGHAPAALVVAEMSLHGEGCARDPMRALRWATVARDRRVPEADPLLREIATALKGIEPVR